MVSASDVIHLAGGGSARVGHVRVGVGGLAVAGSGGRDYPGFAHQVASGVEQVSGLLDHLPLNQNGKVVKTELRELAQSWSTSPTRPNLVATGEHHA